MSEGPIEKPVWRRSDKREFLKLKIKGGHLAESNGCLLLVGELIQPGEGSWAWEVRRGDSVVAFGMDRGPTWAKRCAENVASMSPEEAASRFSPDTPTPLSAARPQAD